MTRTEEQNKQFTSLAAHLSSRRDAILQHWRQLVEADPRLTTASYLSRAQFNDHIPEVIDAFERELCLPKPIDQAEASASQREGAAEHGTHRWQQGYDQRQVMCEWAHLQLCLLDELERHHAAHTELEFGVMTTARRALTHLCSEGAIESATRYAQLQQVEASGRLRDLEQALAQVNELERQRALLWREAAHDLRGNLSVVKNAALGLNKDGVPDGVRAKFLVSIQKGVESLHALLTDLTDLARLEAGHEHRSLKRFDVATVLQDLCGNYQETAARRGLFLTVEGPPSLNVDGDAIKVARIAQNLLVNALMYTDRGGIIVTWKLENEGAPERWMLCVQDTGPGFDTGQVNPIARQLKQATEEAQDVEDKDANAAGSPSGEPAPTLTSLSSGQSPRAPMGEGIGLAIVKRLCEILDASLELQTAPGEGTTFRIIFPIRY
ncbi:MAG: sensor histidine kinase [Burkholderiales bacterium]